MKITISINGKREQREIEPSRTLLELVREDFGLTGTKAYCHSGICGACTVLLDGAAVSSCSLLAAQADGADVTTIEGLAAGTTLHPIQQAFIDHFGFQCGYCTPGMVLLTKALLDEVPEPTREEIVRYMGGNICRCTGYAGILASVEAAAKALSGEIPAGET
ncbi:MAG: (2Fe-2S)-binding protein [Chloroflexi bacterium]|nr:(2Fe-2S)-binding protein [Chloroflexota bacterium]